jgi:hypothetical protein
LTTFAALLHRVVDAKTMAASPKKKIALVEPAGMTEP